MSDVAELDRIGKIIACLDSPHEGEAIAALRLARTRLAALGLTIADWQRLQAKGATPINIAITKPHTPPANTANTASTNTDWQRVATETADRLWQLGQELYALGLDKHLDTARNTSKTAKSS